MGTTAIVAASAALLAATDSAHAQSTWLGVTANYRANANWDNATPPVTAGRSAIFTNAGASTSVNITTAPGAVSPDNWTFTANALNYTFTGADVNFSVAGPAGGIIDNANAGQTIIIKNNIGQSTPGVTAEVLGNSTLVLAGTNTYSGGTIALGGTIRATNNSSFGTGLITLDNATIGGDGVHNINIGNTINAQNTLAPANTVDNTGAKFTLSGTVFGDGGLKLIDSTGSFVAGFTSGRTVLSGANTYTGGTSVTGTIVQANNNSAFGTGAVMLDFAQVQTNGSNLTLSNNFVLNNTISVPVSPTSSFSGAFFDANGATLRLSGNISGPGTLGTLDSTGIFSSVILTGNNTYTGGTIVCSCSTLQIGSVSTPGSIVGPVTNEGQLFFINGDTSGIAKIDNEGGSQTTFRNSTNAGTMTVNNKFDPFFGPSALDFRQNASAANATINNDAFSQVTFHNTSTAGNALINNTASMFGPGVVSFLANSNAGSATIYNSGVVVFADQSSAQDARIANNDFGQVQFFNTSTAGSATIVNNADGSFGGVVFNNNSTAGNSWITTNATALTIFTGHADGGTARFDTALGGTVDFSFSTGPGGLGRINAGSIAGAGDYFIGAGNTLAVGGNNLSTEVSGTIADSCGCGPGSGALEKVGTGTLTLSGLNTYSGGTTFTGGTVSVSQEANLGAAGGALNFNGGILQVTGTSFGSTSRTINWEANGGGFDIADPAHTFTVGQTLTGAGGLAKLGPGTLVLIGPNSYGGGTTIAGGTLSISADNNIGTGPLTMFDGSALQFTSGFTFTHPVSVAGDPTFDVTSGTVTMSAAITDGAVPGDLVKAGSGVLVLAANNTYTGGTVIDAGILQLGDLSNPGHILGAVINNANFQVVNSDFAGITTLNNIGGTDFRGTSSAGSALIGNSGTINFRNNSTAGNSTIINYLGGNLAFRGSSTAADATVVNNGYVEIGGFGTGGNAQFINNAGGLIDFSTTTGPANDGNVSAGSIAGAGNVYLGAAMLSLGGNNLSTTISGVISDCGPTGSECSSVVNALGPAAGGGLIKTGAGTLTLTAVNTYTGATTVNAGALIVNGSIAPSSGLTVNAGGFVGGTGTLPSTTINGGTLSPGNSIGTINVAGNLAFVGPGNYVIEVSPTAADRTNVTGTASLAGNVSASFAPGAYTQAHYTILSAAGGVSGTFDSLTTSNLPAFLSAKLSYTATDVLLDLTSGFGQLLGSTRNQRATGGALDAAFDAGVFPAGLFGLFGLPMGSVPRALDQLSGEVHASTAGVLVDESLYVRSAVLGRLRQASYGGDTSMAALAVGGPQLALQDDALSALAYDKARLPAKAPLTAPVPSRDIAFWAQGFGAKGKFDGDGNAASLRRDLAGFFTGVDARFGDVRGGIAAGYTGSRNNLDGRGSATVETGHLAAYGGWSFGSLKLRAGGAYASHTIDTDRTIMFPGFFDRATAHYDGATGQFFGEAGYGFAFGKVAVEPFAGAAWVHLSTAAFGEKGGAAALNAAANSFEAGYSTLGIRAAGMIPIGIDMMLVPRGSLAWQHAFNDVTPLATLAFQGAGVPFMIAGVPIARDSILAEAGLDLAIGRHATLGVSYVGQLASNVRDHAAKGKFSWKF